MLLVYESSNLYVGTRKHNIRKDDVLRFQPMANGIAKNQRVLYLLSKKDTQITIGCCSDQVLEWNLVTSASTIN